ncbi:MAG: hypothetical protein PHQ64_03965 [Bacilli bacterium]|nr:hypothetical protein [Bacilli bacterium]
MGNLSLSEIKYVLDIIRLISNEKNTYFLSNAIKVQTEDNLGHYTLTVNKNNIKVEINITIEKNKITIKETSNDKEKITSLKQKNDEVELYTSEDNKTRKFIYILEDITKNIPSELLAKQEKEKADNLEESFFKLRDEQRLEDLRQIINDSIQIKGLLKSVDDSYLRKSEEFRKYSNNEEEFHQIFGANYDLQRKFLSELSKEKVYTPLFRLYGINARLINKEEFDKYFNFELMDNTNSIYYELKNQEDLEDDITNKIILNDIIIRDISRAYQINDSKKILNIARRQS